MSNEVFRDQVVIVTGASSGIGRAMALQLAEAGARLSLASRDVARLEEVAKDVRQWGAAALIVPTDVGQHAQCKNLIQTTIAAYGRLDTLINNAGLTMWARLEDLRDLTMLETLMQVNYFGSVYCTFEALQYLKESQGRIVAVSSLTGKGGVPTRSGYAASKHAMAGFFDSLRIELKAYNVSVTVAYPDFVATETRRRAFGADGRPLGKSPVLESKVMSAETCARLILAAAATRRREIVMGLRGKLGLWLKLIAPGLIDQIAIRAIKKGI